MELQLYCVWNERNLEQRADQKESLGSLTISVAVYNIGRCIMSILLQHLLHQQKLMCYFLARHAPLIRYFRSPEKLADAQPEYRRRRDPSDSFTPERTL
jgi:hypothetical protein